MEHLNDIDRLDVVLARSDAVLSEVRAMRRDLTDIKHWQERHEAAHQAAADKAGEQRVTLESRLTRVEGSMSIRSWIGGLGILGSAIAAALGLKGGNP